MTEDSATDAAVERFLLTGLAPKFSHQAGCSVSCIISILLMPPPPYPRPLLPFAFFDLQGVSESCPSSRGWRLPEMVWRLTDRKCGVDEWDRDILAEVGKPYCESWVVSVLGVMGYKVWIDTCATLLLTMCGLPAMRA